LALAGWVALDWEAPKVVWVDYSEAFPVAEASEFLGLAWHTPEINEPRAITVIFESGSDGWTLTSVIDDTHTACQIHEASSKTSHLARQNAIHRWRVPVDSGPESIDRFARFLIVCLT
jgi:hypothetical protein